MQKEIILSGVGGQGMILCGTLIAEAAAVYDRKKATLTSEYGVETRGTFAKSDLIISDEDIFFPDVTDADLVVCLHQTAYARYSGNIPEKAYLLFDSDEVEPNPENSEKEIGVEISKMAKKLGNPATSNILTMGIVVGLLKLVNPESAKRSIRSFFSSKGYKVIALNEHAFDMGYLLADDITPYESV